jgi:hypothetical protein
MSERMDADIQICQRPPSKKDNSIAEDESQIGDIRLSIQDELTAI